MASVQGDRSRTSLWAWPLWAVVCFNMWGFAILGPIFAALGLLSFFVDPGDTLWFGGESVRTEQQKIAFAVCGAAFGALGNAFAWLHRRGYLRFDEQSHRGPN
jgi:hypothetical protein